MIKLEIVLNGLHNNDQTYQRIVCIQGISNSKIQHFEKLSVKSKSSNSLIRSTLFLSISLCTVLSKAVLRVVDQFSDTVLPPPSSFGFSQNRHFIDSRWSAEHVCQTSASSRFALSTSGRHSISHSTHSPRATVGSTLRLDTRQHSSFCS